MTQPVFLLGAPRSGTTLVQRLLNSYPDTLIWGEHAGFLQGIATAFFNGWESSSLFTERVPSVESDPATTWQAWMNGVSRSEWLTAYRQFLGMLWQPPASRSVRVWGFKEIRYHRSPDDRTLELLDILYPDALYVFIVRNPYNVIASLRKYPGGWATRSDLMATCESWLFRYGLYHDWRVRYPERTFWVVYEDLLRGEGEFRRLLERLGHSWGERQDKVLASDEGRGSSFGSEGFNDRWRTLPRKWRQGAHGVLATRAQRFGYAPPELAMLDRVLGRIQRVLTRPTVAMRDGPAAPRGRS